MIPVFKVAMADDAAERVAQVVRSGVLEHGPRAAQFEAELGGRLGSERVVAVNCATSGLHLALHLISGRGRSATPAPLPRDEVLSTPLTFEGTTWPVLGNGLRVRWLDTDPTTLNLDLDDLERKLTPRTLAILVVHWLGCPVNLPRLNEILDRFEAAHGHRPAVVEDCAQAWGARIEGQPLGGSGNIAVYSFHAVKLLTAGGGGALVLPDEDLYQRALRTRWLGIDRADDRTRGNYDVREWGYRFPISEINAEIGLANLAHIDGLVAKQQVNAEFYDLALPGTPGISTTRRSQGHESAFWAYPVLVDRREEFMDALETAGIGTSIVSRRNDALSVMSDCAEPLPGLDSVYERLCYIPVGWWVSDRDRQHIVDTIAAGW